MKAKVSVVSDPGRPDISAMRSESGILRQYDPEDQLGNQLNFNGQPCTSHPVFMG